MMALFRLSADEFTFPNRVHPCRFCSLVLRSLSSLGRSRGVRYTSILGWKHSDNYQSIRPISFALRSSYLVKNEATGDGSYWTFGAKYRHIFDLLCRWSFLILHFLLACTLARSEIFGATSPIVILLASVLPSFLSKLLPP